MRPHIVLTLLLAAALAPRAEANPCAKADAARAAKNHAAARPLYVEVITAAAKLQQPALAACAETGLFALNADEGAAAELMTRGEIAEARGDTAAARAAYVEAVRLHPGSKKAHEGLLRVNGQEPPVVLDLTGADAHYATARRLLQLGLREKAAEEIAKALAKDPSKEIPPGLKIHAYDEALHLHRAGYRTEAETAAREAAKKSGRPIPFELEAVDVGPWGELKRTFLAWADFYAFLAAILLVAGTLAYLIRLRREPRLEIPDFEPEENVPTQHSASITAMVREALGRFAPDAPKYSIATVRETIEPLVIPDSILGAIPVPLSPLIRILPEVIQRFTRGRVIRLEGRVHPPGARGTGLTLSLTFERITIGSITLWQGDFDPGAVRDKTPDKFSAGDYYALAEPAAIWLLFHLEKAEAHA